MNGSRRAGAFGGARVGPLPYTAVGVAEAWPVGEVREISRLPDGDSWAIFR